MVLSRDCKHRHFTQTKVKEWQVFIIRTDLLAIMSNLINTKST